MEKVDILSDYKGAKWKLGTKFFDENEQKFFLGIIRIK
jgi:hypothetical protein